MEWWNGLSETRRAHWLVMAASAMPAAARHAYLLAEAYNDAMDEGESWSAETAYAEGFNAQSPRLTSKPP